MEKTRRGDVEGGDEGSGHGTIPHANSRCAEKYKKSSVSLFCHAPVHYAYLLCWHKLLSLYLRFELDGFRQPINFVSIK